MSKHITCEDIELYFFELAEEAKSNIRIIDFKSPSDLRTLAHNLQTLAAIYNALKEIKA